MSIQTNCDFNRQNKSRTSITFHETGKKPPGACIETVVHLKMTMSFNFPPSARHNNTNSTSSLMVTYVSKL